MGIPPRCFRARRSCRNETPGPLRSSGAKPEPRITLTYPALNSSDLVLFLVAGAEKHPVLEGLANGADYPASGIAPDGELVWLLDQSAATGNKE